MEANHSQANPSDNKLTGVLFRVTYEPVSSWAVGARNSYPKIKANHEATK